jgi:twitching motility protein PilI
MNCSACCVQRSRSDETQMNTNEVTQPWHMRQAAGAAPLDSIVGAGATSSRPFDRLSEMAALASRFALPLPRARAEVDAGWRGLGFQIGGLRFAATIGDAVEVLRMPRLTPVPWVKSFVLGLANIRGRLLPVFDMHELLDLAPTCPRQQWRVLVAQSGERHFGLTIEQSFGLQQFPPDSETDERMNIGLVSQYVGSVYRHGGRVWNTLELQRVVQDPAFQNVAL